MAKENCDLTLRITEISIYTCVCVRVCVCVCVCATGIRLKLSFQTPQMKSQAAKYFIRVGIVDEQDPHRDHVCVLGSKGHTTVLFSSKSVQ
jgi:hypothetical protein